jgi:hypothetical protein
MAVSENVATIFLAHYDTPSTRTNSIPHEERQHEAESADHHQDDPDHRDVDPGKLHIDGEIKNGSKGQEKQACAEAHGTPSFRPVVGQF